jgi:phospholipid/cholesterol/gamma-HCH transport system permease protein
MVADKLALVGAWVHEHVAGFGRFTLFCVATARWLALGVTRWARPALLMPQLWRIGTRSAPVIMLLGSFMGMVLSVELFEQFRQFGQEARMGGVINIAVVRHIGPVLAAVMLAGRVGGSVSAELGTMRVTEQIDALRAIGADPHAYLVLPRVVACVVMIPILTVFSDLLGIFGGYMITVRGFGVSSEAYWQFSADFITGYDLFTGLAKSVVFGLAIGLISCYKGFHCRAGAEGVGRAATDSFVTSFVAIIISNFFLAKLLQDLYIIIYGPV